LNDPTVTSLPPGFQFLAGLFQAASTRTAGFSVVNLPELHPAVQVSYMIMMYISVFPIAMSIRQSNVYEERSLGVWHSGEYQEDSQSSYLSHHLRRQLSFDLWYVFLGFFLIAIIEGSRLDNKNEYAFSLFAVLFEIISAYGTVGLSQGFPGFNTSFSGQFHTLSKLIIIAMQIRGRHRGLPYGLDRAILLPSESLHQKENEDATIRARVATNASSAGEPVTRTNSGLSYRTDDTSASKRGVVFQAKQVRKTLAGAFRAGPTTPLWEKEA
jgi:Trk-type K+ transport system membrane component